MAKANHRLTFVRRNIRTRSSSTKEKLFNTLVRPHLEYAATVVPSHLQAETLARDGTTKSCEMGYQQTHNTSCVSDMLHTLGWTSLEHRRASSRLCMLFQIYHGSIGIPLDPYNYPPIQTYSTTLASNICTPSQHTSAGLTIFNVLASTKQLLRGMPSLKVWSLAPHWSGRGIGAYCHWGDRYQASVFGHTNLSCF